MESLSVGGLASGLDTNAIIDGLTDLERLKVSRLENRQKSYEVKLDAFNQLKSQISEFASTAEGFSKVEAFNLFNSKSSDEENVTVSGTEDAIPGSYQVEVESLATSWKVTSKAFTSTVQAFGFAGKFEISTTKETIENDPTKTAIEIQVDANDTLKDIVAKINAADGSGAKASIISLGADDYRLVLSAVDEGTQSFSIKDTGGVNILDAGGLDIISYQQRVQSDFNFRLETVGAAASTTLLTDVFSGIGINSDVDAGDEIQIVGTDANGIAVGGNLILGAASTIQDLLNQTKTIFEGNGATVDVSLNSSGEIIITDTSGGVQEMTLEMSFNDLNASGSTMQLTPAGSQGKVQNVFNNVLTEGKKAFFNIDGLSVASDSNKNDTVVTGTVFELHKAELGKIVDVELSRDISGIKEKIQSFIDGYNGIISFLNEKSRVNLSDTTDADPNAKQEIKSKGPFAGDSTILRIKSDLRSMLTSVIDQLSASTNYSSAATIGISSQGLDGTVSIDDEKLDKALKLDFEGVRRLFINSGFSDNPAHSMGRFTKDTKTGIYEIDADNNKFDSLSGAGFNMVDGQRSGEVLTSSEGDSMGLSIEASSGTGSFTFIRGIAGQIAKYWEESSDTFNGLFTQTGESLQSNIDEYKKRVVTMEEKVEAYRQRLINQFSNLEQAMSRLQQQSSSFQSQIGALN